MNYNVGYEMREGHGMKVKRYRIQPVKSYGRFGMSNKEGETFF